MKSSLSAKRFSCSLLVSAFFLTVTSASSWAGNYTDSAHGNTTVGVNRSATATLGYKRGNCAHCHDQHASRELTTHDPAAYALFTENFDTSVTGDPYSESDNICFSCHNDSGSIMQVDNRTYAETFGGFSPTYAVNSIFDAFIPISDYDTSHTDHNLKDVYNYALANFSYFKAGSNPCAACHNPHLAKRNKTDVDNPSLTAISRPTDHDNLWGDGAGEKMNDYTSSYQPPYYTTDSNYEPGGIATHSGDKIPDYNTFCLDCHANEVLATNAGTPTANPNTTSGYLTAIDWSSAGDIHGGAPRYAGNYDGTPSAYLRPPYDDETPEPGATSPNYVLSCLDCHEPHGTVLENKYNTYYVRWWYSNLIRKKVNGEVVDCPTCGGPQNDSDWKFEYLCDNCHTNFGSHCGGPGACFYCHYHGARNIESGCGVTWNQGTF